MKKTIFYLLIVFLSLSFFPAGGHSQPVSLSEARNIAGNWIHYIISRKGRWGNSKKAQVAHTHELRRRDRLLGYICDVDPAGCIVIPNTKQLSPIKYFSVRHRFDPESEQGLVALVKDRLERYLQSTEKNPFQAKTVYGRKRYDRYKESWKKLSMSPESFQESMESEITPQDYQEGENLMITYWHQKEPYNDQCPEMGCSWECNTNTNALVGCPSIAGSQIFKYWGWPPYGTEGPYSDPYDWSHMPTSFASNCGWWDPVKVDAVAELCYEVAVAFQSNFGCDGTGGQVSFLSVLPYFRYSNAAVLLKRSNYPNTEDWEQLIIAEIEKRRPIYYHIPGHQIVIDGWMYDLGIKKFHVNYGAGFSSYTGWFDIDDIPGGEPAQEAMIIQVYPNRSLGATLSGSYPLLHSFPYRYFDQDATGDAAIFQPGQKLQFLRKIVVQCESSSGSYIKFYGSASNPTKLFSNGDESKGIALYNDNSSLVLHMGGSIQFR